MIKDYSTIKITSDKRYHAAGLVVDTLDEAFDRCDKKSKQNLNVYSLGVSGDDETWEYFFGTRHFLRECEPQLLRYIEKN